MPHAAGLAFSPIANIFLILAVHSTVQPCAESDNLTMINPFEELVGSANLPAIASPINMAFDSKANRLFLFNTASQELIAIKADSNGYVDPMAINRFDAQKFGVLNPQGMAVDPVDGALFILSVTNSRIVWIKPDAQGNFDGGDAQAEGRISQIDLSGLGLGSLRGLAFNPTNEHLYILNPLWLKLFEVSKTGQLVAIRDLSVLDLGYRDPQGIVFAPSGDLTDDPAQMNLYLVDSGLGTLSTGTLVKSQFRLPLINVSGQVDDAFAGKSPSPWANEGRKAKQGPGRIIEFTLTQPVGIPPAGVSHTSDTHSIAMTTMI
jgi:DNA-binding beta-propeller fold protein YncE